MLKKRQLTEKVSDIHSLLFRRSSRSVVNSVTPVKKFNSLDGFFVIAHRGASFDAPENSMPAFKRAHDLKADMIELDVLLTRDSIPVVLHDDTLNRTTSGSGPISEMLFREIQELDAGRWFSEKFRDTRIPSLQTVLRWAKDRISLNIEIKGVNKGRGNRTGIVGAVLDLVHQYEMKEHVVISSFSCDALQRVKKISPNTATAYLNSEYSYGTQRDYGKMLSCRADGLNLKARQMNNDLMEKLIENDIPVWVYTVNQEIIMRDVIERGATGIFTDRPDLLRRVVLDEKI